MDSNKKYDAIIFDLDGTLWDTIDSCMQSLDYIKNKYSDITKKITRDEVKASMGKTVTEIAKIYYNYLPEGKAIRYLNEVLEINKNNLFKNGGTLYTNTKNTVKELSKRYDLYIVSNCVDGYIESFFNTSGLGEYFKDFESYGRTKLNKGENIKLIIERNNLKNSIYVGDTMGDKKATIIAGIPFIYASYGFGHVDEYDYKIDDIEDLLKIFKKK